MVQATEEAKKFLWSETLGTIWYDWFEEGPTHLKNGINAGIERGGGLVARLRGGHVARRGLSAGVVPELVTTLQEDYTDSVEGIVEDREALIAELEAEGGEDAELAEELAEVPGYSSDDVAKLKSGLATISAKAQHITYDTRNNRFVVINGHQDPELQESVTTINDQLGDRGDLSIITDADNMAGPLSRRKDWLGSAVAPALFESEAIAGDAERLLLEGGYFVVGPESVTVIGAQGHGTLETKLSKGINKLLPAIRAAKDEALQEDKQVVLCEQIRDGTVVGNAEGFKRVLKWVSLPLATYHAGKIALEATTGMQAPPDLDFYVNNAALIASVEIPAFSEVMEIVAEADFRPQLRVDIAREKAKAAGTRKEKEQFEALAQKFLASFEDEQIYQKWQLVGAGFAAINLVGQAGAGNLSDPFIYGASVSAAVGMNNVIGNAAYWLTRQKANKRTILRERVAKDARKALQYGLDAILDPKALSKEEMERDLGELNPEILELFSIKEAPGLAELEKGIEKETEARLKEMSRGKKATTYTKSIIKEVGGKLVAPVTGTLNWLGKATGIIEKDTRVRGLEVECTTKLSGKEKLAYRASDAVAAPKTFLKTSAQSTKDFVNRPFYLHNLTVPAAFLLMNLGVGMSDFNPGEVLKTIEVTTVGGALYASSMAALQAFTSSLGAADTALAAQAAASQIQITQAWEAKNKIKGQYSAVIGEALAGNEDTAVVYEIDLSAIGVDATTQSPSKVVDDLLGVVSDNYKKVDRSTVRDTEEGEYVGFRRLHHGLVGNRKSGNEQAYVTAIRGAGEESKMMLYVPKSVAEKLEGNAKVSAMLGKDIAEMKYQIKAGED